MNSNLNGNLASKTPSKKLSYESKKTPAKTPAKSPGCKSNPVTPGQQAGNFYICLILPTYIYYIHHRNLDDGFEFQAETDLFPHAVPQILIWVTFW